MTIKQAAELCECDYMRIYHLVRAGRIPAHRAKWPPQSPWQIDVGVAFVRRLVRRTDPVLVFPQVRFRLSDEDCWSQAAPSFMAEGGSTYDRSFVVVDSRYICPHCQSSSSLLWNGVNYYCLDCDPITPVLPVPITERVTRTHFPYPAATVPVQPVTDDYYAQATRYVRVPAASNWPRKRNDPTVNVINEEVQRPARAGFPWVRSKR